MGNRPRGDGKPLSPEELKKLREQVGLPKKGPTDKQKRDWKEKEQEKDDEDE